MHHTMSYNYQISDNAHELLVTWCDKSENQQQRAMLSVKLMNYTD